jgi:pimeloyl-ACP methyl ester carboxylesterase
MTILEQIQSFAQQYGKEVTANSTSWRYYCIGAGKPFLWLTGGLRRAAFGYSFLERLGANYRVIAPDYPPVMTIEEFIHAFDAILQNEGVDSCTLGGQSYGGMLAQAYLARRKEVVERLILSSTGPADYGKAWLPVEVAYIGLARVLPEKTLKKLLAGGLFKIMSLPEQERAEWWEALNAIMQTQLCRADLISHFAVAADLIREGIVSQAAYQNWTGRILVLSAENDPTQSAKDFPRYEKLFGRGVEVVNTGDMGHTGLLLDPGKYVELIEQALS